MTGWPANLIDDDVGLAAILREAKTVAVLGAKADSAEPAYFVPAYLRARGYRIRPVNPKIAGRSVHDATAVARLADLAERADVIEIFRRPEYLPDHAREILALPWQPKAVWFQLGIGYRPQEPQPDPRKDVRGNIEEGVAETRRLLTRFEEVSVRLGEPLEADEMEKLLAEQARLQDQIDAANAWDLDRTVELAMDALRVPPGEMEVAKISGGERRRVALCRRLLSRPDLARRGAPTNRRDAESVAWLERFLKEYPG